MAFEQLSYTKDWTNPADFPTYEPDEAQVRADMQCLFNEIRSFINAKLVGRLNGTGGAADILTSDGTSVEKALSDLEEAISRVAGGTIPDQGQQLGWDLDAGGHRITGLADPQADTDAVSKKAMAEAIAEAVGEFTTDVYHAGTSAPENTKLLWIDTGNGNVIRFFDGASWSQARAAWA